LLFTQVKALYALSSPRILSDNGTSPNPSVLRLSPAPSNGNNSALPSSTPSTPIGPKGDANTTDHGTTTGTVHAHRSTNIDTTSTFSSTSTSSSSGTDHQKKASDSGVLAQKIINKIKQKLKVGDIPFP
jgi:hypothetical protein